jgi:hypothetical protein
MLPEMTILLLTLFHEGSVCQEAELRAIARTIQVRAEDRGTSIHEECLRPYQYSCWNGYAKKHKILKAYNGGQYQGTPAWKRCQRVAQELYDGKLDGMPRWNHYYLKAMKNKPVWSKDMEQKRAYKHHLVGRIEK